MDFKLFLAIFGSVFLAELGDKTQLATFCYAVDGQCSKLGVFLAASAALLLSTLLAVLLGSTLNRFIPPRIIKLTAGSAFVLIGFWVIWGGLKN